MVAAGSYGQQLAGLGVCVRLPESNLQIKVRQVKQKLFKCWGLLLPCKVVRAVSIVILRFSERNISFFFFFFILLLIVFPFHSGSPLTKASAICTLS